MPEQERNEARLHQHGSLHVSPAQAGPAIRTTASERNWRNWAPFLGWDPQSSATSSPSSLPAPKEKGGRGKARAAWDIHTQAFQCPPATTLRVSGYTGSFIVTPLAQVSSVSSHCFLSSEWGSLTGHLLIYSLFHTAGIPHSALCAVCPAGLLLQLPAGLRGGVFAGSQPAQCAQPPTHPLRPALQSWVGDPTAALDPFRPTGLCIGNTVFFAERAKRQMLQIPILGKNPPNHSLSLSPEETADCGLGPHTAWGHFLQLKGQEDQIHDPGLCNPLRSRPTTQT